MRVNTIIIDDFYQDPDIVRSFALSQDFHVKGNYPGLRTKSFLNDECMESISKLMAYPGGKITDWLLNEDQNGYTGCFQLCTSLDRTWIHTDQYNTWAGICYLTPNAPLTSGTAIYKHKKSNEMVFIEGSKYEKDPYDYTQWELVDKIGNLYNRLIIFRGDLYHASLDYFGSNFENGRLFQTFFFNTEY